MHGRSPVACGENEDSSKARGESRSRGRRGRSPSGNLDLRGFEDPVKNFVQLVNSVPSLPGSFHHRDTEFAEGLEIGEFKRKGRRIKFRNANFSDSAPSACLCGHADRRLGGAISESFIEIDVAGMGQRFEDYPVKQQRTGPALAITHSRNHDATPSSRRRSSWKIS